MDNREVKWEGLCYVYDAQGSGNENLVFFFHRLNLNGHVTLYLTHQCKQ